MKSILLSATVTGLLALGLAPNASADAIVDWNHRSAKIIGESRLGTPPAIRAMALVQTAAYEAVRDTAVAGSEAQQLAIAAAHRVVLHQLLPAQQAGIEAAYSAAVSSLVDDVAFQRHAEAGRSAAQRVLASRAAEMPGGSDEYRPATTAGAYVPTVLPAVTQWTRRKPWMLDRIDQFRPGPPPALTSERWRRDYDETKTLGARESRTRSAEQTTVGRFWDYSLPDIYHGIVRSVAQQGGRSILDNARLFATIAQAMDDAVMAVFDAKYAYNFWRPITAVRNGDLDNHDGTQRDPGWLPLIETPMHPEYPCAHCILAATVGTVLEAQGALPKLITSSPSAAGLTRSWATPEAFIQEVLTARIVAGVHFRNSAETGMAMGRQIGALALARGPSADE